MERVEDKKIGLWKNKNFIRLLLATMFSAPGYYIYLIGAEWLMLNLDDNRFYFGMLFIAASVPRLIFMTYGGVLADRVNRPTIIFIAGLTRAFLGLTIFVFVYTNTITVWHLIIVACLFGIADAFSHPATSSLIPNLVEEEQLQRANSMIQTFAMISPILGPAAGGLLIATTGFKGVFLIGGLMMLLASMIIRGLKLEERSHKDNQEGFWQAFKSGVHYVKNDPFIMSVFMMAFIINFLFAGPIAIGLPILIKDVLQGTAVHLATVESASGIGALIGTLLLVFISFKKQGKLVITSLAISGILIITLGLSTKVATVVILFVLMGIILQFVNIPIMTLLQKNVEKDMLGRMMSLLMTVSTGLIPISFLVTSTLVSMAISIQLIMLISGIIILFISLLQFNNKVLKTI
ncbi:MAG TPA: MFS transporter [Pseudogracilibacillus sp.]|nr:MFS transporter [Pseudogracilibacillus sp.]